MQEKSEGTLRPSNYEKSSVEKRSMLALARQHDQARDALC